MDEMYQFNACMRRERMDLNRRSKVDKVIGISCLLLAMTEFSFYLIIFWDRRKYNRSVCTYLLTGTFKR